jgi:hypothetical protein
MSIEVGKYYTLEQFRANPMPSDDNSLTMKIVGKDLGSGD